MTNDETAKPACAQRGLSARASLASALDKDADEILTVTRQSFDELHRLFGIRYPFGDYHQAFVPEFNAGAMENPGCVTFRDPLIFTSRATRGVPLGCGGRRDEQLVHRGHHRELDARSNLVRAIDEGILRRLPSACGRLPLGERVERLHARRPELGESARQRRRVAQAR